MTDSAHIKEGHAVFNHPKLPKGEECRTWYRINGSISSGTPLVLLHGGPGSTHVGLTRCFDSYPALTGTAVVYYDQLGCGNSTRLPAKKGDESFWTPELFVAELDNLVRHLGIRGNFDLYGHSWGAKLAAKYAASTEAKGSGLRKVILSSGSAKQQDLIDSVKKDIAEMPEETQRLIRRCIAEGREDDHDYQMAFWEFCKKRISAGIPPPKEGEILTSRFVPDDVVYSTMLGKDPFHVDQGSLRTFDMTEECKKITQPVLLLNGEREEAGNVQPFFDGIPKIKWYVFSGSGHAASADQPEKYKSVIWDFLKR